MPRAGVLGLSLLPVAHHRLEQSHSLAKTNVDLKKRVVRGIRARKRPTKKIR